MEPARFKLGSLVESASPLRLPPGRSDSMQNIDFPETGAVARRPGMQRYLTSTLTGKISLLAGVDNNDGTRELLYMDETGEGHQ